MYGPKGVERTYALHSQPRKQAGGELPLKGCRRRIPTHDERSTPLGPMMMGARAFRGFAALTRGYRVVRPLRGRQHRRMPIQMWYEDRGTTTTCSGDGDGDDVAPVILQRNGDGDDGPKGAELFCNRG